MAEESRNKTCEISGLVRFVGMMFHKMFYCNLCLIKEIFQETTRPRSAMIANWLDHPSVKGSYKCIISGPEGVGQFWNVIAGYHQAPAGDLFAGKGNCAFLDGHVSAHSRKETFQLAWPN